MPPTCTHAHTLTCTLEAFMNTHMHTRSIQISGDMKALKNSGGGTLLIYGLTLFWPLLEWWISFQPCQSRFPVSFSTVIWLFWALTGSGRSLDPQNWQVRVSVTCSGNAPPATTLLVPGSRYPSRRIYMAKVDKVTDSFNGQFQTFATWELFPGWVSLIG